MTHSSFVRCLLLLVALPLALLTATVAATEDRLEHVPVILAIKCSIQKSQPPNLVISVVGQVPTSGWKNPQLDPRIYVKPPADRVWEYDFLAKRPSGPVLQVLTEIKGEHTWKDYPEAQVKGVRVFGVGNGVKEIKLSDCVK